MSKLLKAMKAKVLDLGLNFISVDEKIAYVAFNTKSSYVKPIVLLPTGQDTMKKLKRRMKEPQRIGNLLNGTLNGIKVSVIRAGMGGPHVAIVMEALKRSSCKIAIRIDYCGGLKSVDEELGISDVIVPHEVFLTDGTSHSYIQTYSEKMQSHIINSVPVKQEDLMYYPDYKHQYFTTSPSSLLEDIILNLKTGKSYDFKIQSGKLWSVDALFCETEEAIKTWVSYGANSVDMESATTYLLGKLFNIHTISVLGISDLPDSSEWNFQKNNKIHPKFEFILDNAIDIVYDALPKIQNKVLSK